MMVGGQNLTPAADCAGGLELDYRLLLPVGKKVCLGPKVGLGALYRNTFLKCEQTAWSYQEVFPNGQTMVSSIDLTGAERTSQWQLEVPVMLALNAKGLVLNVGLIPILGLTQQHLTHLDHPLVTTLIEQTDAMFPGTLAVRDDPQRFHPQIGLLVGGEIGYEFVIGKAHRLGVQAYGRYNVLPEQPWSKDVFCERQEQQLVGGSLTQAFSDKLHYVDFGLRVYYTFAYPHHFRRLGLLY